MPVLRATRSDEKFAQAGVTLRHLLANTFGVRYSDFGHCLNIRVIRGCLLPPKKLEKFSLKSVEEIKYKRRNVQQVRAEIVS